MPSHGNSGSIFDNIPLKRMNLQKSEVEVISMRSSSMTESDLDRDEDISENQILSKN